MEQRRNQIEDGKQENTCDPIKILELAQNVSDQYVTFSPPQKRQIVESVFSNLQLADVSLYAEYRLPFSILTENANRPPDYARQDSNLRPPV